MVTTKDPGIVIEQVLNYCGKKAYQKAVEYSATGALYVTYKDRGALRALCRGKIAKSYSVSVVLDQEGIARSACTCYAREFGPCKHVGAVLIAWYQCPESFPERLKLLRDLKKLRKAQLLELAQKMILLHPEPAEKKAVARGQLGLYA